MSPRVATTAFLGCHGRLAVWRPPAWPWWHARTFSRDRSLIITFNPLASDHQPGYQRQPPCFTKVQLRLAKQPREFGELALHLMPIVEQVFLECLHKVFVWRVSNDLAMILHAFVHSMGTSSVSPVLYHKKCFYGSGNVSPMFLQGFCSAWSEQFLGTLGGRVFE